MVSITDSINLGAFIKIIYGGVHQPNIFKLEIGCFKVESYFLIGQQRFIFLLLRGNQLGVLLFQRAKSYFLVSQQSLHTPACFEAISLSMLFLSTRQSVRHSYDYFFHLLKLCLELIDFAAQSLLLKYDPVVK